MNRTLRMILAVVAGFVLGSVVNSALIMISGKVIAPAYIVGGLFLVGGVINAFILPAPAWFIAVDLILAYLPAAWLGQVLADRFTRRGITQHA